MKHRLSSSHAQKPQPAAPIRSVLPAKAAPPSKASARTAPVAALPAAAPATSTALDLHTVRIGYFQPDAREVYVAGTFNDWEPRETPLTRDSFGDWAVELSLPPGEHRYRLVVDGEWTDDPSAQRMEANPFGGFDAVIFV